MEHETDLMEYLMTSDFNEEDISPEKYINLLKEFRVKYRLLSGKYDRLNVEHDELNKKIIKTEESNKELKKRNNKLLNSLKQYRTKKLSFKERITGKIRNIN